MNSSSSFPKTRGGVSKRPMTAPKMRRKLARLKKEEIQEKEKHRYSYWRHDTTVLKQHQMLNNVNPSPRDPKADEKARRRKLHDTSWKVGRENKLGLSRNGPPTVEVDTTTGEVRVLRPESKGWPLDSSMRQSWGPRPVSDPWQKPLDSVPPGDWPKDKYSQPSPRGLHHPWSPPRHGSTTGELFLGMKGNIFSKGQRRSYMATTTPSEKLRRTEEEEEAAAAAKRRRREQQQGRPTTAIGGRGHGGGGGGGGGRRRSSGKVQFMSTVSKVREEGGGGGSGGGDWDSPMRGRLRAKTRPQSAAPSPARGRNRSGSKGSSGQQQQQQQQQQQPKTTPKRRALTRAQSSTGIRSDVPSLTLSRPQSSTLHGGRSRVGHDNIMGEQHNGGLARARPSTANPSRGSSSPSLHKSQSTRSFTHHNGASMTPKRRPHTASAASPSSSSSMRSPYGIGQTTLSPGGTLRKQRPHTAHAMGTNGAGIRRSASGAPKYMRPTTATRTKQLYRTGQYPSGRWKMEGGSHSVS